MKSKEFYKELVPVPTARERKFLAKWDQSALYNMKAQPTL